MYQNTYKNIFAEKINQLINESKMSDTQLAKKIAERTNAPDSAESWRQKLWKYKNGQQLPSIPDCIDLCNTLDISIDWLLGGFDKPNRENAFISDKTGLTEENIKRLKKLSESSIMEEKNLDRENRIKHNMSKERLKAVNTILSSEEGLRIVEQMMNYLAIDPDTLIVDTPGGAFGYGENDFVLVGHSTDKEESIIIKKEEIANMYLVGILNELSNLKKNNSAKSPKSKRK